MTNVLLRMFQELQIYSTIFNYRCLPNTYKLATSVKVNGTTSIKAVSFALRVSLEEAPKIQTVKSTACVSKKNKTFHRKAFFATFHTSTHLFDTCADSDIHYDVIVTKKASSGFGHQMSPAYLFTFLAWIAGDFQILWYSLLRDPEIKVDTLDLPQNKINHFLLLQFIDLLSLISKVPGSTHFLSTPW